MKPFIFTHLVTITATVIFPIEKILLLESIARRYCFALCAAMLSSKQLLWHSPVVVGLKREVPDQYPFPETFYNAIKPASRIRFYFFQYLKLLFEDLPFFRGGGSESRLELLFGYGLIAMSFSMLT
jgi:hypothetical protein